MKKANIIQQYHPSAPRGPHWHRSQAALILLKTEGNETMTEINVSHMIQDENRMFELSGSVMEHGKNASQITWNNAKDYGAEHPLLTTEEMKEAARSHFAEYGAWSEDEIAAWSDGELQAITCQDVAAAIREMEVAEDYEDYQRLCEAGTCSGRLYKGDDGQWYFYLGT